MGTAIAVRTAYSSKELRRLASRVKNAGQARRLLAIAAVLDGASRQEAAIDLRNSEISQFEETIERSTSHVCAYISRDGDIATGAAFAVGLAQPYLGLKKLGYVTALSNRCRHSAPCCMGCLSARKRRTRNSCCSSGALRSARYPKTPAARPNR